MGGTTRHEGTEGIDWTRPVETLDGRKVTIYCTNAPGPYPVHGRVEGSSGPGSWKLNGYFSEDGATYSETNLRNVRRKVRVHGWLNVYANGSGALHLDRADANCYATSARIACLEFDREVEEGEGL